MVSMPWNPQAQNPYGSKGMLRTLAMFFGRTDVLRRAYAEIRDRQCLSLIGTRRIGKSSVLGLLPHPELQKRVGYDLSQCVFAFIDLEEHIQQTCEDFFWYVMRQLVTQSAGRLVRLPQGNDADTFRTFLDEVRSDGYHPVLLLDEFDSVTTNTQFDFSFFALLRAQANAGKVSYITASKESLDKVCHADIHGSPFFNLFSTCELGPLTQQEAFDLATLPAQSAGCPLTQEEAAWVLKYGGRHPFFIQRLCYYLFEEKMGAHDNNDRNHSMGPDLSRVIQAASTELQPHFTYTWAHMEEGAKEQLQWEARREQVSQRRIPAFSESLLFREFVRSTHGADLTSITIDDLCDIMDNLSNLRFLGESKLSSLNLVYRQIQDARRMSAIEKGAIVDALLQRAVDTLRGAAPRQGSENEWRLHNILVWRHRDKLQNDEIAARLGIGLRHFYRERKRAAKTLLDVLMRMEVASLAELENGSDSSVQ